jgi:hypothetical protein
LSDAAPTTPVARFSWIRPGWFLAGLALGLGGLAWAGLVAARTDYHPGFVRFSLPIAPETSYYPTLNEMKAIVRSRCRRDQVLVIVGGNSILLGVWQPVADLWTKRLQDLLGDRYCVLNFAFRGAAPTDGGAVVAEALRREYPHQIYIANVAPLDWIDMIGHEPYEYLFWQAYFSGQLIRTPERDRAMAEYWGQKGQTRHFLEEAVSEWFDCALHYRDLWNRECFENFCTVPSNLGGCVPALLKPRRLFPDEEPDALNPEFIRRKYAPSGLAAEMDIVRGFTASFYRKGPGGNWRSTPLERMQFLLNHLEAFPAPLAGRTLILVSRNSPYYVRQLTADERAREEQGYRDGVLFWRKAGHPSMEYGRDFADNDFGDRTHLSSTGGRKLAEAVAPEVRIIAERLGYLK